MSAIAHNWSYFPKFKQNFWSILGYGAPLTVSIATTARKSLIFNQASCFIVQETSSDTFPFLFSLKLICTCEFFKKLKLQSSKRLVQFQLFEKLTRAI